MGAVAGQRRADWPGWVGKGRTRIFASRGGDAERRRDAQHLEEVVIVGPGAAPRPAFVQNAAQRVHVHLRTHEMYFQSFFKRHSGATVTPNQNDMRQ